MSDIILTAYDGAILGPIAKILGWIMNGIYNIVYNLFGFEHYFTYFCNLYVFVSNHL